MTVLKILQYPDPRLKRVGHQVDAIDARISSIINDMFETHYATQNCAALAATQLDIDNPPAITVIDFSDEKDQPLCLVNPVLTEPEGEEKSPEGCMSVADVPIYEHVKRPAKIRVKAWDRDGKPLDFVAEGFMAKCIQHEVDHLKGILFIDKLSRLKRARIEERFAKFLSKRSPRR